MYLLSRAARAARVALFLSAVFAVADRAVAQSAEQGGAHQHQAPATEDGAAPQHEHQHPAGATTDGNSMTREASGTGWLPDLSPMYAVHSQSGPWSLMVHGHLFVQYLNDGGDRGRDQTGSINWIMGMAQRNVGQGRVGFRGMLSLEPWTIGGCGYPDLLASGERCEGKTIHDQQHPHDLFMELSAEYDRLVARSTRWQIYGGLAGEPALGPVAFPHRVSAIGNPLAPVSHHWMDSTHVTFGVVTGGVYGRRWKAESSLFNGREPDEDRTDINLAALDSFSGRIWVLPNDRLALQLSAGHLEGAEPGHDGEPAADVNRITASATYHRRFHDTNLWATTMGWGRNSERDEATNALMIETTLTFKSRDVGFGRLEIVKKSSHDLGVAGPEQFFAISKLEGGYVRYLPAWIGINAGFGGMVTAGIVPGALRAVYGSRVNAGVGVFLTLRPAEHPMQASQ